MFKKMFVMLVLFAALVMANNWTMNGTAVYWTENGYTIRATPATSNEIINHYQLINFSSVNPTPSVVNLSFVFDQQPISGDVLLWQNMSHTVNVPYSTRMNFTRTIDNVISYNASVLPCTFGDEQNLLKYTVTNASGTVVACFNSFTNVSNNYTLSYSLNGTAYAPQTQYWNDWGSIIGSFLYTYSANHHIYTINNVPFSNGTNYVTKFMYSFPAASYGKFDIYAHSGSPAQVIAGTAPIFVQLDPWWNSTWQKKIEINTSGWACTGNNCQFPIYVGLNTSCTNGSDIRVLNSTEDGELFFWREDGWNYTNASGNLWVNASNGTTKLYVYFNSSSSVDKSNIDGTFVFGDDFNGQTSINASKWTLINGSANIFVKPENNLVKFNSTTEDWIALRYYSPLAVSKDTELITRTKHVFSNAAFGYPQVGGWSDNITAPLMWDMGDDWLLPLQLGYTQLANRNSGTRAAIYTYPAVPVSSGTWYIDHLYYNLTHAKQVMSNGITNDTGWNAAIYTDTPSRVQLGFYGYSVSEVREIYVDYTFVKQLSYGTPSFVIGAEQNEVTNAAPNNASVGNFSDAGASHSFLVNGSVIDADGGTDIVGVNASTTLGSCSYVTNETSDDVFLAVFNCTSTVPGAAVVSIGFTDAGAAYTQASSASHAFPDHAAYTTVPTITPATAYTNDTLSCNNGTFSDTDGDVENATARSYIWYKNGVNVSVGQTLVLSSASAVHGDNFTCNITVKAINWTNSTAWNVSAARFINAKPVEITFVNQTPTDIDITNVQVATLRINYSLTGDIVPNSVVLLYKANDTLSNTHYYQNGTAFSGYFTSAVYANESENYTWRLLDNEVYPGTYMVGAVSADNAVHTAYALNNANDFVKSQMISLVGNKQWGYYEIMANSTAGASPARALYCNSSYTTGKLTTSPFCTTFATFTANTTYTHCHLNASCHRGASFTVNLTSGMIGTVKVTNDSFFAFGGAAGWTVWTVPTVVRTDTTQTTTSGGTAYTSRAYTADMHVHQFQGNATLYYYVCANSTNTTTVCSAVRSDLMELKGLPPQAPNVVIPANTTYSRGANINITYGASESPNGYPIMYYNITLNYVNGTVASVIQGNNSNALFYNWNTLGITVGQYIVGVRAYDNESQSSIAYSEPFYLTFTQANGSELQNGTARPDANVKWTVNITVVGYGNCTYPIARSAIQNATVIYDSAGNTIANRGNFTALTFTCNESGSNYTIAFETEPVYQHLFYAADFIAVPGDTNTKVLLYSSAAQGINLSFNYTLPTNYGSWVLTCAGTTNASCVNGQIYSSTDFTLSGLNITKTVFLTSNETVILVAWRTTPTTGGGSGGGSIGGGTDIGDGTDEGIAPSPELESVFMLFLAPFDSFLKGELLGIPGYMIAVVLLGGVVFIDLRPGRNRPVRISPLGIAALVGILAILSVYGGSLLA